MRRPDLAELHKLAVSDHGTARGARKSETLLAILRSIPVKRKSRGQRIHERRRKAEARRRR
jgi:hypothetical protein